MKDMLTENHKTVMKKIEKDKQIKGKISYVHGWKELVLLKCPYYPKPSIQCNPMVYFIKIEQS